MNSLRARISGILILALIGLGSLGGIAFHSFIEYENKASGLVQSVKMVEFTENLKARSFQNKKLKQLKQWHSQLVTEQRTKALKKVIQAYSKRQEGLLRKRVRFFKKSEKAYREFVQPHLSFLKNKIIYFGALSLIVALGSLGLTYLFVWKSIFGPLSELSQKMIDFLNNRFSYKFSVPAPNEVGYLHATFNSLAQRVLTNMEELKALDKAKSEFLSIASHELRTPLTSVKGSLSLLKNGISGNINEKSKNLINIAEMETDRLIRLINDLLDLAKIEAHKFPLNKEWCELESTILQTFEGLQGLAKTAEVQLESKEIPKIEIYMDRDRIQQVITNLVSNAVKYSPKGGAVTLRAFVDEQEKVVIAVKDEGEGIAPEDQELIFESFRQITDPDNPLVKGTGLGLAIAKALVDEHEGEIRVTSKPGEGSTFYFTLNDWRPSEKATHENSDDSVEAA